MKCFGILKGTIPISLARLTNHIVYVCAFLTNFGPALVSSPEMSCGIFINTEFPFLGATPDGSVYDPNELEQPYGYLEVKCPYSVRDCTPEEACSASNFYCNLDSTRKLKLKETHQYFAQVQG